MTLAVMSMSKVTLTQLALLIKTLSVVALCIMALKYGILQNLTYPKNIMTLTPMSTGIMTLSQTELLLMTLVLMLNVVIMTFYSECHYVVYY